MTLSGHPHLDDAETAFLERLRAQYEAQGYTFTIAPQDLPGFFRGYMPDAIAQKAGSNIAIALKRYQTAASPALQDIRRRFKGHPGWQLNVAFMGTDPQQSITIRPAEPAAIRARMSEVGSLNEEGHRRAAFVLAWSLLDAALHSTETEAAERTRPPGTVVQTLAMNGYIEPEIERRLRPLIQLRNRIVHGDLEADPAPAEVRAVLAAVEAALSAAAAP